ncbi:hypothetical protein M388_12530 [Mesotoga sp. Brook.08.YT.4.2.5.4.]|nr:hypothetical protein M388_12530 [Mesotoga sp. Brook.08.YT.4.2.5.4.]
MLEFLEKKQGTSMSITLLWSTIYGMNHNDECAKIDRYPKTGEIERFFACLFH